MATEIERKYLVVGDAWRGRGPAVPYRQGYLCTEPARIVRVRIMGDRAAITVKGLRRGAARPEFEYPVPVDDAEQLLDLCLQPVLEKTRTTIRVGDLDWEVDEFHGANAGLVTAECELEREDQPVAKPDWVGPEVTGDARYANSSLVSRPFSSW